MKRSEARLEIAKLLTDLCDDEVALKRANLILTKIEKLGMGPPPNSQASDIPVLGQLCEWEYEGENHE